MAEAPVAQQQDGQERHGRRASASLRGEVHWSPEPKSRGLAIAMVTKHGAMRERRLRHAVVARDKRLVVPMGRKKAVAVAVSALI